jgi:hypothetical protein
LSVGFGHYEDRTRRVVENGASDASDERRPEATPAVRANDDEVGIPVHGRFDEPMRRAPVFRAALGLEACLPQTGVGLSGERFMVLVQLCAGGSVRFPQGRPAQPGIPLRIDVGDAEHADTGSVQDRPAANDVRRRGGAVGAVFAEQDAVDVISTGDENRQAAVVDHLG